MGVIDGLLSALFGGDRNVVRDTVEVFRENAEASARRDDAHLARVVEEFGAEFAQERSGWFDRAIDGVNRLPRPAMALGTVALLVAAMAAPDWFARRMEGLTLVPQPLWWLLGAIVSFYFGARHQIKGQQFQRSLARSLARAAQRPAAAVESALPAESEEAAQGGGGASNAALEDWRKSRS